MNDDFHKYSRSKVATDWVLMLLRPTYPLILPSDIDRVVAKLVETNANSVQTICPVTVHPHWMKTVEGDRIEPFVSYNRPMLRRQDLPPVYQTGGLDATWTRVIREKQRIIGDDVCGVVVDGERVIDIDTLADFDQTEAMLRQVQNPSGNT